MTQLICKQFENDQNCYVKYHMYVDLYYVDKANYSERVSRFGKGRNVSRVKTCVTIKSTVSYQRVQSCTPSHLCVPWNWWLLGKKATQRTSRPSWESRNEREKRERSTGTKLTPLLLFFFYPPYSQLEITQALSTRRRVASLP